MSSIKEETFEKTESRKKSDEDLELLEIRVKSKQSKKTHSYSDKYLEKKDQSQLSLKSV
jgi:hypothetical protein